MTFTMMFPGGLQGTCAGATQNLMVEVVMLSHSFADSQQPSPLHLQHTSSKHHLKASTQILHAASRDTLNTCSCGHCLKLP